MAYKIYLSPAAHATDNPTKCADKCGENVHANAYMDIVEKRLVELGFAVKRGDKSLTGSKAMTTRTAEANNWGADLYYVAHTNAGGGRYSVTYCYPNAASQQKAAVIGKYRKALEAYNGYKWRAKTTDDLYEINTTKMVCLYDELFFHDNALDCAWFHADGMAQTAEETVHAICDMFAVPYDAPVKEVALTSDDLTRVTQAVAGIASLSGEEQKRYDLNSDGRVDSDDLTALAGRVAKIDAPEPSYTPGYPISLTAGKLYLASTGKLSVTRSGTYFLYDGQPVNGRYRVTNRLDRVGKKPVGINVSGWVEL